MELGLLSKITCGNYREESNIGEVLENIAFTITKIENRIIKLPSEDEETITMHGPFYARTLLENVCIALIGRLDPFHLLFIQNVQKHGELNLGRQSSASIRWSGDVIDKKAAPDNLWKVEKDFNNIERGLFGGYYGEIFWRSAFENILDFQVASDERDFLLEYRDIEPEKFTARVRDEALSLYSALSKGIHVEFVIKMDTIYDKKTVLHLVKRTLALCSILALVSHAIGSAIFPMDLEQATQLYKGLKEIGDDYDK